MKNLKFFDADCTVGVPVNATSIAASCDELLKELDYYGVEKS